MEDMRECMAFEEDDWNTDATDLTMWLAVLDGWIADLKQPLPWWLYSILKWWRYKHAGIVYWWKVKQCVKWQRKHGNNNTRA